MRLKLRGHHLVCLHFFKGEGYDSGFIDNLKSILKMAKRGKITILFGADDICGRCPHLKDERCIYDENGEEWIQAMDYKALELLSLDIGMEITWGMIKECLPGIFPDWYKSFCKYCDWKGACEKSKPFQRLKENLLEGDEEVYKR